MSFFPLPQSRGLHYRCLGQGAPLVLLHGWSYCGEVFDKLAGSLAHHRQLLIPDLPGHGRSEAAPQQSLGEICADLEAWLAARTNEGVVILGWSLGGQIALALAARGRIPVKSLILISSTPKFTASADWTFGLPEAQLRSMQRHFARNPQLCIQQFQHNIDARRSCPRLPDAATAARGLELLGSIDLRPMLSGITCPVLLLHGSQDNVIPRSASGYLSRVLPDSRLETLEGGGHAPFWEDPSWVLRQLEAFLS